MRRTFYNRFIKPLSTDSDLAEREIVLNYLLVGILTLSVVAFFVTLMGPITSGVAARPNRLAGNLLTILFVVACYFLARYKRQYKAVAVLLTLLIAVFGGFVLWQWGFLNTNGILLFGLAVVMAGILVGARYSLYITCAIAVFLVYLQNGQANGNLHPDLSWLGTTPVLGDALGLATILFLIALVSWLFNRQMELSLKRARRSEKALQHQKELLETKVKERTRELEAAQLSQMQELYRFAELGRLSTALFHDLANHLTTVSVDIEGIGETHPSDIMQRMRDNVRHIDSVVQRVRQQIQGKSSIEVFDIMDEVGGIVRLLTFSAGRRDVAISVETDGLEGGLLYKGDLTRFRQILMNTITNAIESYPDAPPGKGSQERPVIIGLSRHKTILTMTVTDFGSVIPARIQTSIFEPFYTTKPKGVGIGLFVVKQVVENDFKGTISVTSDKQQGTIFTISLPKSFYGKATRH
jgi:signal transduction histidine kinase